MGQKQYRTIEAFISHRKLAGWKTPRPQRELSWKEVQALYRKAKALASEKNTRETSNSESQYFRIEEEIMTTCLSWTKHGEKPLPVRIHDWLEDNISIRFLQKPFALRQELWYRAIGWEFNSWRFHMARKYFDGKAEVLWKQRQTADKTIEEAINKELRFKEKGVEAAKINTLSKGIDGMMKHQERIWRRFLTLDKREEAWYDDYYRQTALLHNWLDWRGFELSDRDMKYRLSIYIYLGT